MNNSTTISEFKIPKIAKIKGVQLAFSSYLKNNKYNSPLLIEMSEVMFIPLPITTLVYLAQLIYKREKLGLVTKLRLPVNVNVRTVMFTWRFFEIVEELTGHKIFHFLIEKIDQFPQSKIQIEDKDFYLDINRDYFDNYYREDQLKHLVRKGFFSLICEPFSEDRDRLLALKRQSRYWTTERLITDVLQANLFEKAAIGNLLANTIIFECLTNAANHPNSDHLVVGSYYDYNNIKSRNKDKKLFFTIVLWDDGDSIIDTLSESIKLGNNIRAKESFEVAKKSGLKSWFRVVRKNYISKKLESIFYDHLPTKEAENDEILLSSFLPGISRKPINSEDKLNGMSTSSGTGIGLTLLLKAVVADLGGTIHLRTKNYHLELAQARAGGGVETNDILYYKRLPFDADKEKNVDFYCKSELHQYEDDSSSFLGNMITIKIPLRQS